MIESCTNNNSTESKLKTDEKLTVMMPNYNDSASIISSLEAVCNQSLNADEVIVIDDGSTDNSVEIIQQFAKNHPNVRLIAKEKNEGVNAAINTALNEANGDVFYVASANDSVYPDFFESGMKLLGQHPEAGIYCAEMLMRGCGDSPYKNVETVLNTLTRTGYYTPEQFASELKGRLIHSPTALFRRFQNKDYSLDLEWHADWWYFTSAAFRHGVCYETKQVVCFKSDGSGYSRNMFDPEKQKPIFLAVLDLAMENQDILPLMMKGRIFNLFTFWGADVVGFDTLGKFLTKYKMSLQAIRLSFHIICEKVRYYVQSSKGSLTISMSKILEVLSRFQNKTYYLMKGRLLDLKELVYKVYFHSYHLFNEIRNSLK